MHVSPGPRSAYNCSSRRNENSLRDPDGFYTMIFFFFMVLKLKATHTFSSQMLGACVLMLDHTEQK